jgi:hypothetical protein
VGVGEPLAYAVGRGQLTSIEIDLLNPMLTSLLLEPVGDRQNDDRPMVAGASIYVKGFDSIRSRTRPLGDRFGDGCPGGGVLLDLGTLPAWNGVGHGFPAGGRRDSIDAAQSDPTVSPTALLCRRRYGFSRRRRGTTTERGYGSAYQRLARAAIAQQPWCSACGTTHV